MDPDEPAFEPGGASVDQGDPMGAKAVRHALPHGVDCGGPPRKPVGDELLGAGQHVDVECVSLNDRGVRRRLTLESNEDPWRVGGDRDQAAGRHAAVAVPGSPPDHHNARPPAPPDVPKVVLWQVLHSLPRERPAPPSKVESTARRRRSQVARQRSAKPPSPVRFWASPPYCRTRTAKPRVGTPTGRWEIADVVTLGMHSFSG